LDWKPVRGGFVVEKDVQFSKARSGNLSLSGERGKVRDSISFQQKKRGTIWKDLRTGKTEGSGPCRPLLLVGEITGKEGQRVGKCAEKRKRTTLGKHLCGVPQGDETGGRGGFDGNRASGLEGKNEQQTKWGPEEELGNITKESIIGSTNNTNYYYKKKRRKFPKSVGISGNFLEKIQGQKEGSHKDKQKEASLNHSETPRRVKKKTRDSFNFKKPRLAR